MISGKFTDAGVRRVPYLTCEFEFPQFPHLGTSSIDLLIDTGADRTALSRTMAESIGLDLSILPDGGTSTGVGGVTAVRMVESALSVQGYSVTLWVRIQESRHRAPSILGRDFMLSFALFMEERTGRVLFLDPDDLDRLGLSAPPVNP